MAAKRRAKGEGAGSTSARTTAEPGSTSYKPPRKRSASTYYARTRKEVAECSLGEMAEPSLPRPGFLNTLRPSMD